MAEDFGLANDLAAQLPEKLEEMQALFHPGGDEEQRAARSTTAPSRG